MKVQVFARLIPCRRHSLLLALTLRCQAAAAASRENTEHCHYLFP